MRKNATNAHNTERVNPSSASAPNLPSVDRNFLKKFSSCRDIPESFRSTILKARIWAVFSPNVERALMTSDKYFDCEKLVKSILIPAFVVRFDPVIY